MKTQTNSTAGGKSEIKSSVFRLPRIRGVIDRRMLVNFRCDPKALARVLPRPFRPKLMKGFGMAGICLIRLRNVRPAGIPAMFGLGSENAAHRIAVEWDDGDETREGVFIPRRDTNSPLNRLAGGRMFPGVHHSAEFQVRETDEKFELEMRGTDGEFVHVRARVAAEFPTGSIFDSMENASAFFEAGGLGWSPARNCCEFEGLELFCPEWRMEPLQVEHVESSFFGNRDLFPPGAAEFDSAFLMRDIAHEWRSRGKMISAKP